MVQRLLIASILLGCLGLTTAEAREQHGKTMENHRWGYKVRAPKDWASRAIRLDERWIAGKYFPAYTLRTRNDQGEFVQHKPDLWVIGFPHAREAERRKVERPDEHTTIITIKNPYKDYKDFVEREAWASTGQGGWYYSKEEAIERDGVKIDVYEIKVEKLVVAPLRIVTWVYHFEDVDFAVQLRILETGYAENKAVIEGVMKSFQQIPRTEAFPEDDDEDEPTVDAAENLTLEEINARRVAKVEDRIQRELDNLPRDWRAKSGKHFVILGPKDSAYTMPMTWTLNFAREIRKYLEKHFKDIGPAKVPRGIIRIFKSSAEEAAYNQGTSRGWWADEVGEITLTWSRESSLLSEFSMVARRLTDQYFHIKNENLRNGMPGWIREGIWGHIGWARPSKRKKMILQPVPSDIIAVRRMLAAESQLSVRHLMTIAGEHVEMEHHAQARSVVYYLLSRGNKGKLKGAIARYLKALEDIIKEEDERFEASEVLRMRDEARRQAAEADAGGQRKTPEELEREEDERFRQRRQNRGNFNEGLKARFAAIRERAQAAAFGHLDDKSWESLDKRWQKFAKG